MCRNITSILNKNKRCKTQSVAIEDKKTEIKIDIIEQFNY